jgi:hypothetical protein
MRFKRILTDTSPPRTYFKIVLMWIFTDPGGSGLSLPKGTKGRRILKTNLCFVKEIAQKPGKNPLSGA